MDDAAVGCVSDANLQESLGKMWNTPVHVVFAKNSLVLKSKKEKVV